MASSVNRKSGSDTSLLQMISIIGSIILSCIDSVYAAQNTVSVVKNTPTWVKRYQSYSDVNPMRFDTPAGLSSFELTFLGMKRTGCEDKEIHLNIKRAALPLIEASQESLPDNFVIVDNSSIELIILPGQLATLSLIHPPPGPYYVVGYLKDVASAEKVRQKGLTSPEKCYYFYNTNAKYSRPITARMVLPDTRVEADIDKNGMHFRLLIPEMTVNFRVEVLGCDPSPCSLSAIYLLRSKHSVEWTGECGGSAGDLCVMHVSSPDIDAHHLVRMKSLMTNGSQQITFIVHTQECEILCDPILNENCPLKLPGVYGGKAIAMIPNLDRHQAFTGIGSATVFGIFGGPTRKSLEMNIVSANITVVPFRLIEPTDVGQTLKWGLQLTRDPIDDKCKQLVVCASLQHNRLPDPFSPNNDTEDMCSHPASALLVAGESNRTEARGLMITRYVPYPQIGQWFIVLQAKCYDNDGLELQCSRPVDVKMLVEVDHCIDNKCSHSGTCEISQGTSAISYSTCECTAGYKGYGCTDAREAVPVSEQLAGAYLLTLSNLFFIPAIILGVQRGFWIEAFVYFFNMFFSTFYHACDGNREDRYIVCILDYKSLQLPDFFGSACSLWFTLLAMARIKKKQVTGLLQVSGTFCLFVVVVYDSFSLCVIVLPICVGLLAIFWSWGFRMWRSKRLYPSVRRYLLFLLPGIILAGTGGAIFSFLETKENYKYFHSLWHVCVALSIVLLLPPRQVGDKEKYDGQNGDHALERLP